MNLAQVPNLRVEDFPTQKDWISPFFVLMNAFIQAVNQVFNENVDYSTNIRATTFSSSISSVFQSFSFQWGFTNTNPPTDLRVISATKGTTKTATILLAAWSYNSTNNTITVSQMTEILPSSVAAPSGIYNFTVRASI